MKVQQQPIKVTDCVFTSEAGKFDKDAIAAVIALAKASEAHAIALQAIAENIYSQPGVMGTALRIGGDSE